MEEAMKDYELLCILPPELEGGDLDKIKDEIAQTIKRNQGTISFKESSKKPLAYPINKKGQGIFLVSQISIPPDKIVEFLKELKTNKQILRFLLNQLEANKEEDEKLRIVRKPIKVKKPITKEKLIEPKPSEETLEEIDKKLDEIIGEI
jgi:small subunit ribosomal protein S6